MKVKHDHDQSLLAFILEQLDAIAEVRAKRMFGCYGLYAGEIFFAILCEGKLYFKTNETSRQPYIAWGMEPFKASEKQTLKNYYQVPVEILEDSRQLTQWAKASIAVTVAK